MNTGISFLLIQKEFSFYCSKLNIDISFLLVQKQFSFYCSKLNIGMGVYECVVCKKMTEGFPATLRRKCLVYRNFELEMRYRKKRLEMCSKKELPDCHKALLAKLRDEDIDYSDSFSENDDNKDDEDYIPPTLQHLESCVHSRKRKLFTPKEKKTSKLSKEFLENTTRKRAKSFRYSSFPKEKLLDYLGKV